MLQLRASANLLVTFELLASGRENAEAAEASKYSRLFRIRIVNCELWDVDVEKS
jgi:hypothetical protein